MRRGKIEETRFLLAITEVAEGFEIFRPDHSERMSSMISGSDIAGRSRAASSGSAYIANPVLVLAAKPVPISKPVKGESDRHAASPLIIAPHLVKEPPAGKSIKRKARLASARPNVPNLVGCDLVPLGQGW